MKYFFILFFLTFSLFLSKELLADWNQFHGNIANNGFALVRTEPCSQPYWSVKVGTIHGTSPVIGPDGTIYIGNAQGYLNAINPEGKKKWSLKLKKGWETSTPVVSSKGEIFISCSFKGYKRNNKNNPLEENYSVKSKLFCCSSEGKILWSYSPPKLEDESYHKGFFVSDPKLFEADSHRIFIVVTYWSDILDANESYLLVLNEEGNEISRELLNKQKKEFAPSIETLLREIKKTGSKALPEKSYLPNNALAIMSNPFPYLIVCDETNTIFGFRLDSSLPELVWKHQQLSSQASLISSSPAIFYNGLLAIGRSDGYILLMNPKTGERISDFVPKLHSGIISTGSSFLHDMIFTSLEGEIVLLNKNGFIVKNAFLNAESTSSAAMSMNYIHLNAADGIHTLTHDLKKAGFYEFKGGGTSSPAIDDHGTVYTLSEDTLFAFKGRTH